MGTENYINRAFDEDEDFGRAFYAYEAEDDDPIDVFEDEEEEDLWWAWEDYPKRNYAKALRNKYNFNEKQWLNEKKNYGIHSVNSHLPGSMKAAELERQRELKRKAAAALEKAKAAQALIDSIHANHAQFKQDAVIVKSSVGYTSVLDKKALRMIAAGKRQRFDLGRGLLLGGGGIGSGVAIGTLSAGHAVVASAQLPVTLGIVALASPLIIKATKDLWNWDTHSKAKVAARQAFVLAERESIRTWLSERYGLSVADDVLVELAQVVHENEQQADFDAVDTSSYKFMKVTDAEGWFVFQTGSPLSQREPLVLKATKAEAPSKVFTGEVALIYGRIGELLALLDKQPLSAEQKHVVARVKQDVSATASTLAALAELGSLDAGQKRAAQVLGQLVEELNDLVAGKKAQLMSELETQRIYVGDRRRAVGSGGRLELVKPQAQLEVAETGAEDIKGASREAR